MLNDNLNENDNQNEELPHDVTFQIAYELTEKADGNLIIPDHFDGFIDESAFGHGGYLHSIKANNITQIKSRAFNDRSCISEVDFPNVSIIGDFAFKGTGIEILNLPKLETISSYAFSDMPYLKVINIQNLKNITDTHTMFRECHRLKEIRVGNEEIGREILSRLNLECCEEAKVYVGDSDEPINEDFSNLTDIYQRTAKYLINSEHCVDDTLTIPENFNGTVDCAAFQSNESIKSINFNKIKAISQYAFCSCHNLTEVHGDNVIKIDDGAFYACDKLSIIDFPNVKDILYDAFYKCNMTQIDFPNVQLIDNSTFSDCKNLSQVNLPSVTEIKEFAFSGCSKLSEVNIPNVSTIEERCFSYCKSLTQIDLPSVVTIQNAVFDRCDELRKISIPNIEDIIGAPFPDCNLTEIITSTPDQCELIFDHLEYTIRQRVMHGDCKLLYGSEVWDYYDHLTMKEKIQLMKEEQLRKRDNLEQQEDNN